MRHQPVRKTQGRRVPCRSVNRCGVRPVAGRTIVCETRWSYGAWFQACGCPLRLIGCTSHLKLSTLSSLRKSYWMLLRRWAATMSLVSLLFRSASARPPRCRLVFFLADLARLCHVPSWHAVSVPSPSSRPSVSGLTTMALSQNMRY